MKLTCERDELLRGLLVAGRAVTSRPQTPQLGSILLRADDASLTLTASNLLFGIRQRIAADIQEAGSILLPGRLAELIQSLPSGELQLATARSSSLRVSQGELECVVRCLEAADYPISVPNSRTHLVARVDAAEFREAIQQVSYVARQDDARHADHAERW